MEDLLLFEINTHRCARDVYGVDAYLVKLSKLEKIIGKVDKLKRICMVFYLK